MKALDTRGRVIYVLHPSLRLGYLVLPEPLVEAFTTMRAAVDWQCPLAEQAVAADFLAEGHFGRHVRRMRLLYQGRQEALVEAAKADLGGLLEVAASSAGMHVVGYLDAATDARTAWVPPLDLADPDWESELRLRLSKATRLEERIDEVRAWFDGTPAKTPTALANG